MRRAENIENLIKNAEMDTNANTDKAVLVDVLKAFEKTKNKKSASTQPNIWRIIMKSKITKLAEAAVIIMVVLIAINQFGSSIDVAGVAWAEVAEKVEQIQTYSHRTMQVLVETGESFRSMVYYSSEHGKKIDVYEDGKIIMHSYVLLAEKTAIAIMPAGKKCQKTPLTEEKLQQEIQEGDPRRIVKQFMSMSYKKLGRDKIDGMEVEGIEVENPKIVSDMYENAIGRLWVDVETDLPVRIEINGIAKRGLGQINQVVDDFQWNVDLEADDFKPNIPDDYILVTK